MNKPIFKKKKICRNPQPAKPHPSYNFDARALIQKYEEEMMPMWKPICRT